MADEIADGMQALREKEIPWLVEALGHSISNLGYPVGMGVPPSQNHLEKAANKLFERYAGMIEMAARTRLPVKNPDQQSEKGSHDPAL